MKTPVAIIGGGPAGSTSAMFLRSHGIDCVIIEKEQFPRFHIGESMTGECGAVIRTLGLEDEMNRRKFPIKREAAVFGARGHKWALPVAGRDKDWKLFPQYTWQVRRDEFDKMMLDTAIARGAGFIHGQVSEPIVDDDGAVRGLKVTTADGKTVDIESEMVLDCSGQFTYLASIGLTGPKYIGNYDKQIAIFSRVAGADRAGMAEGGDTWLFYQKKYHWCWFLPVTDDVVSVGTVIPAAYFKEKNESKTDFLTRELHELNPELARRIPDRTLLEPVRSIANYSYQTHHFTGKGFICVGDAHRFVDPIYSFGLCISLKEAQAAASAVKDYLNGKGRDDERPFAAYEIEREMGIDIVEDMMDAFWEYPFPFAKVIHDYEDEMTDIFAGRLWDHQPSAALNKLRAMTKRERSYDGKLTLPAGSRYHPERAHIWVDEAVA
jgi:1H-pyrrole-2-carbonyl-[peptidyl-carrier protein] brominase